MQVVGSDDSNQGMSDEQEHGDCCECIKEGETAAALLAFIITVFDELGNQLICLGLVSEGSLSIIPIVEFTSKAVIVLLTLLIVGILN